MNDAAGLQHELDVLASTLGLSVSLDLPDGTLAAYSTGGADVDPARIEAILNRRVSQRVLDYQRSHVVATALAPVRVPANPGLGMSARTCLPVRCDGDLVAYLWVLDDGRPLGADEHGAFMACAQRLSPTFASTSPRLSDLLARLFDDGPGPELLEHLAEPRSTTDTRLLLHVAVVAPITGRRDQRVPSEEPTPPRVMTTAYEVGRCWVNGRLLVVTRETNPAWRPTILSSPDPAAEDGVVIGRSDPVSLARNRSGTSLIHDLSRQSARAIAAADCAALDPALPEDVHWDQLGAYRRLLIAGDLESWPEPSPISERLTSAPMLERTLEVYLDNAGDAARSIADLGIHRTTFYYRLDRLTKQGIRLDDGLSRIDHHLALKTRRLARARDHYAWSQAMLRRLQGPPT